MLEVRRRKRSYQTTAEQARLHQQSSTEAPGHRSDATRLLCTLLVNLQKPPSTLQTTDAAVVAEGETPLLFANCCFTEQSCCSFQLLHGGSAPILKRIPAACASGGCCSRCSSRTFWRVAHHSWFLERGTEVADTCAHLYWSHESYFTLSKAER